MMDSSLMMGRRCDIGDKVKPVGWIGRDKTRGVLLKDALVRMI